MRLTEVELEGLREIISPILSKTRVLNTFPTRGGLGVLVPDDRESTKIRAAIQQQTRGALVTKFVAKDELVLRIATPQDLQLGKDELEQQLLSKNGLDLSRVGVSRRTRSGAYIIKGPRTDLQGVLKDSYRISKMSPNPLCYRCGKLHPVVGDQCTANPQCINCGKKHQVRECPEWVRYLQQDSTGRTLRHQKQMHLRSTALWWKVRVQITQVQQQPEDIAVVHASTDNWRSKFVSLYADKLIPMAETIRGLDQAVADDLEEILILGGDTNASSGLWSPDTFTGSDPDGKWRRGQDLEFFLLENSLLSVNDVGAGPSFIPYDPTRSPSYIDMVASRGLHWVKTEMTDTIGDHRGILATFRTMGQQRKAKSRRDPRKTNWEVFDKSIGKVPILTPKVSSTKDIDDWAEKLMSSLRKALVVSTPKNKAAGKTRPTASWWTRELDQLRKKLKKAQRSLRVAHRTGAPDAGAREEAKQARKDYNKAIARAKGQGFKRGMSEITEREASKFLKYKHTPRTEYDKEAVLSYYIGEDNRPSTTVVRTRCPSLLGPLGGEIQAAELERMLKQIKGKRNKAPGWDGASYEHVVRAMEHPECRWRIQFTKLVESCLDWGHHPMPFKRADWVLLDKGRGVGPRAVRPVSLTATTAKAIEVLLKNRISARTTPPRGVHGFTRSRSCSTALEAVARVVHNKDKDGLKTALCTWDLKSAFDHVSHAHLKESVIKATSSAAWGEYIESYLADNKVVLDGSSRVRTRGITQGGSLSPCIFSIGTYSLEKSLRHEVRAGGRLVLTVEPRIFADDALAIIRALDVVTLSRGISQSTDSVESWAKRADMATDPEKHEILCLTDDTGELLREELSRERPEEVVHLKREMKWLGVWISKNWRNHASRALTKAGALVARCRRLAGADWGASPEVLLKTWKQSVVSTLLYSVEIWAPASDLKWFQDKCTRLEACLGRMLMGCVRATPTELMAKVASTVARPIWWEARRRTAKYWLHANDTECPGWIAKLLKKWGVSNPEGPKERQIGRDWDPPRDLRLAPEGIERDEGTPGTLTYYSDGSLLALSKTRMEVGSAVVKVIHNKYDASGWLEDFRPFKIDGPANICQAEQLGVLKGLQWSKEVVDQGGERGDGVKAIKICLDSRSAIQSIGGSKETELIRSIRSLVEELTAASIRVCIAWTRGHAGDPGNEASDLAAAIGRRGEAGNVRMCSVPTPCDFTAREIRQRAEVELEERWEKKARGLACNRIGLTYGREQLNTITRRCLRARRGPRRKVWELLSYHSNTRGYRGRSKEYGNQPMTCRHCGKHKETLVHWCWCESREMRKARWAAFRRRIPDGRWSRDTPTVQGMRLIRESICGDGFWKMIKFLRLVAPDWSSGGGQSRRH
ncbi:hypothetical protein FOZ61_000807 [Perkinsus olseni]|uniref:Reverse transcriptase domain-containing protein n=2 Tax=Perkinsus olseni TaxID=32597 RepID=A0A7J6KSV0_PEROL|nr:hypothetical protein FOZ61_000807 [Perkinsus olseni]